MARGRVFVPTVGNSVVALRLADGAQLWTRDVGGMTLSSPTPINGDLIVAAGFPQRHVVRLSGATGEVVWRSPPVMEQFSNTSPAVGAGLVVVGANGGHYYAFDAATGTPRWDYVADGIVHLAAPLIAGGRVYMAGGGKSNRVYAVDAATGAAVTGWPTTLATPAAGHRGDAARPAAGGVVAGGGRRPASSCRRGSTTRWTPTRTDAPTAISRASPWWPSTRRRRAVVWQRDLARAELGDPNDVPKFFICPTPAGFASDGGSALVAAASSLAPAVVVFDGASGLEQSRVAHVGGGAGVAGVRQRPPDHGHDGGRHRRAGVEREPRALGADCRRQRAPDRQRRRDAALAARRRSRRRAAELRDPHRHGR